MRRTCLEMVHSLAQKDDRILFLGSDLGAGTLDAMKQDIPDRFFMEGIAEQSIIGISAGLAMDGFIPYVNTIATFITRRCYEQIAIDLCLHNLPVRLIGNGAGLVYAPLGPTHMAIEDIAIMRALPNMTIVAPADADEMRRFMAVSADWPGPIYIRLAKGYVDPVVSREKDGFTIGRAIRLRSGEDILIMAYGVMVDRALKAAEQLATQGIHAEILNLHTIKPLDTETILSSSRTKKLTVTLEEHSIVGGLGGAVAELFADEGNMPPLLRLALPDQFPEGYGSQNHMIDTRYALSPDNVVKKIIGAMHRG